MRDDVLQFMFRMKDLKVSLSMSAASSISFSKSCVYCENSRFVLYNKTLAPSERSIIM